MAILAQGIGFAKLLVCVFCLGMFLLLLLIALVIIFGAGKASPSTPGQDSAPCPDCGQPVSPHATSCPKCGRRLTV